MNREEREQLIDKFYKDANNGVFDHYTEDEKDELASKIQVAYLENVLEDMGIKSE